MHYLMINATVPSLLVPVVGLDLTLLHVFACSPNFAKSAGIKSRGGKTIHRIVLLRPSSPFINAK